MFSVLYSKDERPSQDNQDKEVQIKYREQKKILPGVRMFVLCVVSTNKVQSNMTLERYRGWFWANT